MTNKPKAVRYLMEIETDLDFSVRFKSNLFTDYCGHLHMRAASEIEEIKVLGPYGSPLKLDTKVQEFT